MDLKTLNRKIYDFVMTTRNKLQWFEQALLDLTELGLTTMKLNTRTEKYYETVNDWQTRFKTQWDKKTTIKKMLVQTNNEKEDQRRWKELWRSGKPENRVKENDLPKMTKVMTKVTESD